MLDNGAHGASVMGCVKPIKTDSLWSDIPTVSQVALRSPSLLNVQSDVEKTTRVMLVPAS